MLRTNEIEQKFSSMIEFEQFRIRWMRSCSRINKNGRNAKKLEEAEERYKIIVD